MDGGDAACWMHLLCPHCGAMLDENPPPDRCWRCGEERDPETPAGSGRPS